MLIILVLQDSDERSLEKVIYCTNKLIKMLCFIKVIRLPAKIQQLLESSNTLMSINFENGFLVSPDQCIVRAYKIRCLASNILKVKQGEYKF